MVAYALSLMDLIPDFIPVPFYLDDVLLLFDLTGGKSNRAKHGCD